MCREEVERVLKEWEKRENEIMNALASISDDVRPLEKELQYDDVLDKLVSFDFKKEIKIFNEKFTEGTRAWILDQVNTWFDHKTSSNRAFIISGLAGMGKSVIAAVICSKFAENIGASHFFQYNNSQYNNPNFFLQSLARHLCNVYPEYKETLVKKLSGNLGRPLNDMNIEGLFSILFKEPFSSLPELERHVLIVLDAIDEAEYDGRHRLGTLISDHMHKLPSFIRFLVTTRPEKKLILGFERLHPLYIDGNDERNLNDLKLVLRKRISSNFSPSTDHVNKLAKFPLLSHKL